MTPARLAEIRATLEAKSAMHSELRRPLSLGGLSRVVKRECVELIVRPHPRIAQLIPQLNGWTIIIDKNQSETARLLCGAHELAHLWLHHDPFFDRSETNVYDGSPPWYDAVREEEADAFAELLVRGPAEQFALELPATVRTNAKPALAAPLPPLPPLPEPPPRSQSSARDYERWLARQGAARVTSSPSTWLSGVAVSEHVTDDDRRIRYDATRRTTRYEDPSGHSWWIYNYTRESGRWERVLDYMKPSITHRLFVDVAGTRRLYQFANKREHRAYRVKHLDRQVAQATTLSKRRTAGTSPADTHPKRDQLNR